MCSPSEHILIRTGRASSAHSHSLPRGFWIRHRRLEDSINAAGWVEGVMRFWGPEMPGEHEYHSLAQVFGLSMENVRNIR